MFSGTPGASPGASGEPARSRPQRDAPPANLPFNAGDADRPTRDRPPIHVHQDDSFLSTTKPFDVPGASASDVALNPPSRGVQFVHPALPPGAGVGDAESPHLSTAPVLGFSNSQAAASGMRRKKSLIRPDRARNDESDRLYNYRLHSAMMEQGGVGRVGASDTGALPGSGLRRGKSVLGREEPGRAEESNINIFKRAATIRRRSGTVGSQSSSEKTAVPNGAADKGPMGPWMFYAHAITCCWPNYCLEACGKRSKEQKQCFREKLALLSIVGILMAAVGFLTFGFTQAICGTPPTRYRTGTIGSGSMIYHGFDYDFSRFNHPAAPGIAGDTNPLYSDFNAAGMDGSFMFQNVNKHCKGIITPASGSGIPKNGDELAWYFPCNMFNQYGNSQVNQTGYTQGQLCHTQPDARSQFAALNSAGPVFYTWEDIKNSSRNLGVYQENVLDFTLFNWLDKSQVSFPEMFSNLAAGNDSFKGKDITMYVQRTQLKGLAECMADTIRVGFIDSMTIGCVAADIVLYVSLVFIIGVVAIRFILAVFFGWFLSWKLGAFPHESYEDRMKRAAEIEHWTDDIYRPAPARYRPNAKPTKQYLPTTSRFTKFDTGPSGTGLKPGPRGSPSGAERPMSAYNSDYRKSSHSLMKPPVGMAMRNSPPGSPGSMAKGSRSSMSLTQSANHSRRSSISAEGMMGPCPFPLNNVVPQPPKDYEPFNFPLIHTICLVTAYSESVEGLRTTLDSLATTDYPNSHKVILVIADGLVRGSGNAATTPEIVLTMMKEFIVPTEEVEAHSYVSIADGHKRHNMAKVYAGFYDYDNDTVEISKQQRVPIVLVSKVGNPHEAGEGKPGNRGKRDSQVLLMSFLQKVMFDERMTVFEYEFFNSIWRCTGVSPDHYETILMVDADTKVFPDSITRLAACMVQDPEIMGLCGETKIANKTETWVTMIQVFEYHISHHLTKAFESTFGGVTCLPGCFSMFRIKSPKGGDGYWVPILANPDIVEHYSENIVDTLHKKNLLLLGEDRYLTTLMLKTFPKRKMMFCPQAVCKTIVPDTFRVLLSQRRRWINSTVHNLFILVQVRDLCGTFCFSMQFMVGMELMGTLVLPAAISFTLYLLIVTCIPGTTKPILSLILLGIILGLPGLLIVVTSRRLAYIGWMFVYLLSLPIWNGILPAYAYLKMDDFSWGQTRIIEGEKKGEVHGTKEGEFDSSQIAMKRWAEFERDRRYKAGVHSRDSTYDVIRTTSPKRTESNRYSVVSSSNTYYSDGHGTNDAFYRQSANHSPSAPGSSTAHGAESSEHVPLRGAPHQQLLQLPAPLAAPRNPSSGTGDYAYQYVDNGAEAPLASQIGASPSEVQLVAPTPEYATEAPYSYDPDDIEEERIMAQPRGRAGAPEHYIQDYDGHGSSPVPPSTGHTEPGSRSSMASKYGGGITLSDSGPVDDGGGMRVVSRQRRQSSVGMKGRRRSEYGHSSQSQGPPPTLPPGAGK